MTLARVVILSCEGSTPEEFFSPGKERLQGSHSVLGWNDSKRVILTWDGTTLGKSLCPGMELLQGGLSVL